MVDLISKKIRGFRDILPEESKKFLFLEEKLHKICPLFNANQIRIPALESLNLFKRSIGESSDIVTKEMYSFNDKNDEIVCMIPEGTASSMRLAFENNLIYDRGIKKIGFTTTHQCSDMSVLKREDIGSSHNLVLSLWVMNQFMMISIYYLCQRCFLQRLNLTTSNSILTL